MRVEDPKLTPNVLARTGLALIATTVLALVFLAPGREAPTLAQPIPTETATPAPTAIPSCPAHTIDRNGNGQDNGDCIPITDTKWAAVPVDNCYAAGGLLRRYGRMVCQPHWWRVGILSPMPVPPIQVNQGCIGARRNPYPRFMVGLGTPKLEFEGLVPTSPAWMTGHGSGWYDVDLTGDETKGLAAHNDLYAAGNWLAQSFGSPTPDYPVVWLHNPAADFYPSINELSMRLVYALSRETAEPLSVSFTGSGLPVLVSWDGDDPLRFTVSRSSNPAAAVGADDVIGSGGANLSGSADLPAYKLQVRSSWILYVQWSYYEYTIAPNALGQGEYRRASNTPNTNAVRVFGPVTGHRVWDAQQATNAGLIGAPNCNAVAGEGYIPVPVLEGQSILVR